MKTIKVAAAIIVDNGRVLATQRGYGEYKDWWEFPGGKLEEKESSLDACRREIAEELGVDICNERFLVNVEWDYPEFHLWMDCYICNIASTAIEMREHEDMRWLSAGDIDSVRWLPADKIVVESIKAKVLA